MTPPGRGKWFSADLVAKQFDGKVSKETPMSVRRSCIGFSGANSVLGAVGGTNQKGALKDFETYSLIERKWTKRPSLNSEREWPGLCYISNGPVYCFCGKNEDRILKSIEKIYLGSNDPRWIRMQKTEVEAYYHIKAIPFKDDILVFGGYFKWKYPVSMTQIVSKLGKVKEEGDYSPVLQGRYPAVKLRSLVYAMYSSNQ